MLLKRLMVLGLLIASASTVTFSATSTSTCVTLTKNLSRTSSDAEVLTLQQFLFDSGYLKIKPSGLFSSITANAVKSFQLANGISPVGTVGPKTRAKVKEVSCKGTVASSSTYKAQDVSCQYKSTPLKLLSSINKLNETIIQSESVLNKTSSDLIKNGDNTKERQDTVDSALQAVQRTKSCYGRLSETLEAEKNNSTLSNTSCLLARTCDELMKKHLVRYLDVVIVELETFNQDVQKLSDDINKK